MTKVNFRTITFRDIEDKEQLFDCQKELGNAIYMQAADIEERDLGRKIYYADGEVELTEGVIVAKRHIHMTTADAAEFGLVDKQIVSVKIASEGRETIFGDVVVRVSDSFALAMHIDTDEANAACAFAGTEGEIIA